MNKNKQRRIEVTVALSAVAAALFILLVIYAWPT